MKKFLAVAASAVFAVSMFGFSACSKAEENGGEIKGNYTQPTAEELTSAINSIDFDKAFGDGTTNSGFEILSKLSTNMSASSGSSKMDLDLGYKLLLGEDKFLGEGSASVKSESKAGNSIQSSEYKATVYNDSQWGYAEITGISDAPVKGKINFEKLITSDPEYPDDSNWAAREANEIVPVPEFDAATIINACQTYKIDLGLDNSDGVKIKASVTTDTIWTLLSLADATEEEIATAKQAITFNSFKLDLYLAFDSQMLFSQASIDMDIDVKIDVDKLSGIIEDIPVPGAGSFSGELVFGIKGYLTLKTFNGDITLPSGIENDTTYVDMTDMLGDLM